MDLVIVGCYECCDIWYDIGCQWQVGVGIGGDVGVMVVGFDVFQDMVGIWKQDQFGCGICLFQVFGVLYVNLDILCFLKDEYWFLEWCDECCWIDCYFVDQEVLNGWMEQG